MLVTQQPVLRRFWYPIMPVGKLGDAPYGFTLLGTPIVLWRKEDGSIACIEDRCCHRSAKLSLGYLEGGNVVCGYHGWTFDASGKCVRIPQRENPEATGKIGVSGYRAVERYGHVWVALGEPLAELPHIPEADEPGLRKIDQFFEPWKIGALRLMENSFDNAHVAFTHRKTFGEASEPIPAKNELEEYDYGFHLRAEIPVKIRGDLATKVLSAGEGDTVRKLKNTWFMPFVRRLGITYPNGLRHTIITAATPMTDDTTMLVQWCYRSDTEEQAPAADIVAFDRLVTLEDKVILESCDPDVPLDERFETHMPSDMPGLRMRRMLRELLARHGETEVTRHRRPAQAAE
ncbi:MAG: Rieske 2Fe-2S domain-containing protein [Rhodospirillales bacterium]|jgi:phenylpropionate dioxygenase-like ring-hydroxylating dioxygenase large terminal subunit